MTDLSPAAQAIWEAYERADCDPYQIDPRRAGLASALRALQLHVAPLDTNLRQTRIRCNILAIAAELDGER